MRLSVAFVGVPEFKILLTEIEGTLKMEKEIICNPSEPLESHFG
jgi:hypothetical protein